jgi:predicted RNA-binding protein with TRAM domain
VFIKLRPDFLEYTKGAYIMADNFDSQFEDEDLDEDFDENPVEEDEDFEEDFDDDFDQDFDDDDQDFEEDQEEDDFEEENDFEEESSDDSGGDDNDYDKPVDEGDVVEVEIDDLGSKGDGIARIDGFVIFVPGGEVGESYDVEVTSVGRKFAFAEIQD